VIRGRTGRVERNLLGHQDSGVGPVCSDAPAVALVAELGADSGTVGKLDHLDGNLWIGVEDDNPGL
jgi:hypothetical protein